MALCSRYVLKPSGAIQRRRPITTRARLKSFLAGVRGTHGLVPARRALGLIADDSGSPAQTELFALAAWPQELGGEHIQGLTLNHQVQPTSHDRKLFDMPGQQYFEIALYHAKCHAGIDYEHEPSSRAAYVQDRSRRNALVSRGLQVLGANAAVVHDPDELDLMLRQLAHLCEHDPSHRDHADPRARDQLRLRLEGPDRLRL